MKDQSGSRMQAMIDQGVTDFDLPDLDSDEYLVRIMFDLKPLRVSGEQVTPTDWPVITPFAQAMGIEADDALTLSRMCQAYHDAWREGENPLAIAPVDRER